jgi:hypothetical protein
MGCIGTELSDFGARNLLESPFLLPNCAGWFHILEVLFAGGGGCSVLHVLIMGHWGIQIALDFEV